MIIKKQTIQNPIIDIIVSAAPIVVELVLNLETVDEAVARILRRHRERKAIRKKQKFEIPLLGYIQEQVGIEKRRYGRTLINIADNSFYCGYYSEEFGWYVDYETQQILRIEAIGEDEAKVLLSDHLKKIGYLSI